MEVAEHKDINDEGQTIHIPAAQTTATDDSSKINVSEAKKEVSMVVEGVYAAKAAKKLADKYGVEMPIVNEVNKVLFEGKEPAAAVKDLMLRDNVVEMEDIPWTG